MDIKSFFNNIKYFLSRRKRTKRILKNKLTIFFEIFLLLKIISPENFSIHKIDLAKDDFPDPDSPTKPSAEFFLIDKLIF